VCVSSIDTVALLAATPEEAQPVAVTSLEDPHLSPIRSFGAVAVVTLLAAYASRADGIQGGPKSKVVSGYSRLWAALTSGRDVTVVVRFNLCTIVGTSKAGPLMTGGFHIGEFLAVDNQYLAFSSVHATLSSKNERVTEYIRYRATPDSKVSIRTTSLQPDGSVGNASEYSCEIGAGVEVWPSDIEHLSSRDRSGRIW
jgi:hypothetical protein